MIVMTMVSQTAEMAKSESHFRLKVDILPKDPDFLFRFELVLFIALERLISYFSFIYSII